jgi:hypothetical protein
VYVAFCVPTRQPTLWLCLPALTTRTITAQSLLLSCSLALVQELVHSLLEETNVSEALQQAESQTQQDPLFDELSRAIAAPVGTPLGPNLAKLLQEQGLTGGDLPAGLLPELFVSSDYQIVPLKDAIQKAEESKNKIEALYAAQYAEHEEMYKMHGAKREQESKRPHPRQSIRASAFFDSVTKPVNLATL